MCVCARVFSVVWCGVVRYGACILIALPIVGPMHHVRWQSEESDEDFSSNVETISASPEFDAVRHQVLT